MLKNILCDSEYYRNITDLVAQGAMALPAGVPAAGQGEPLPGVTRPPPREGDVVGGEIGRVAWHVSGYTCTRHAWHAWHLAGRAPPGRGSTRSSSAGPSRAGTGTPRSSAWCRRGTWPRSLHNFRSIEFPNFDLLKCLFRKNPIPK